MEVTIARTERRRAACQRQLRAMSCRADTPYLSRFRALALLLFSLTVALLFASSAPAEIAQYGYRIVHVYPHDTHAFTEGLFYQDGFLYESTGLNGHSGIRKERLETAEIIQEREISPQYFGEGIVAWRGRLIELTWQSHVAFIYDLTSFRPISEFHYPGEGWALTSDHRRLIMSDGTPVLRLLDPVTFRQIGRITVTDGGAPVANLNELEWVKGLILANIWQTDTIVEIDPANGRVIGRIDLTGLLGGTPADPNAVLNGIAYDAVHDRLFVTGKDWPKLFEIKLIRK